MKDFDALKDIWHGQTALPNVNPEDILKRIKQTKLRFANKLLFQVFSCGIAIAILLFVLLKSEFRYGTSQISILIFICSLSYYLFVQIRDYRKIANSEKLAESPGEYITYLKNYKHRRYILNTRIYIVYMIFIALGLALGFIEAFLYMPAWQLIAAIVFTIFWFAICYFVFMKLYIRKEEARLNEMIGNLERLQKQFNDSNELN